MLKLFNEKSHSDSITQFFQNALLSIVLAFIATFFVAQNIIGPYLTSHPSKDHYTFFFPYFFAKSDVPLYILSTAFCVGIFLLLLLVSSVIKPKTTFFSALFSPIAAGFLFWIIIQPSEIITKYTLSPLIFIFIAMSYVVQLFFFRRALPKWVTEMFFAIALGKVLIPKIAPMVQSSSLENRYGILFTGGLFLAFIGSVLFSYRQQLKTLTKYYHPIYLFLLSGVIITAMTMPQINRCAQGVWYGYDIYFSVLPAYHVLHGGIPLFTSISQYGILYLIPWAVTLLFFPRIPWTYDTTVIITAVWMIISYSAIAYVLSRIIKNSFVALATIASAFYFTSINRYYAFPDPFAPACGPAFSVLRFDVFYIPLYVLSAFVKTQSKKYFLLFLIISAGLTLYSVEVGLGLAASGLVTACLYAFSLKKQKIRNLLTTIGIFLGAVYFLFFAYIIVGFFITRTPPDISTYWLFTKIFSSGFYLIAIENNIWFVILVSFAFLSLLFGIYLLFIEKRSKGLLFIYLTFVQFAFLPYHLGRTAEPTFYNVFLPTIFIMGFLVDEIWANRERYFSESILVLFGIVSAAFLMSGTVQTASAILIEWRNPVAEVKQLGSFIATSFSTWQVKTTPQYAFLKDNLPEDCSLILFDSEQWDLLPALGRISAIRYQFIRDYMVAQEQIDYEMTYLQQRKQPVCVFRNLAEFHNHTEHIRKTYNYFWEKLSPYLSLIKTSDDGVYELYTMKYQ